MLVVAAWLVLQGGVAQDPVEKRVEDTLAKMTLDEKVGMISGTDGFYIRGIERLGLPRLKMSDGPAGVRNYGPTTAYPAPVSLAATWDPALAQQFGVAIGRDARSRGVHIWLGPGMNLDRSPQNGRNFEYLGEDPWLASRMAVGIVKGVQSQGVVATIKHYVANDHEDDRNNDSSDVDERTLRELYLRPFEASVKEGGAWALMSSYNLVNGVHMSENATLINEVLKKEWGFQGVHMSDWGGTHSTVAALKNGLDLEMPGGDWFRLDQVKPLVEKGEIPQATIDDKVRRILRMEFAMGFPDRPQEDATIPKDDPANAEKALQIAREGIVLLKNEGNLLPLKPEGKVILVGPNASAAVTGGGGSAYTRPFASVTVADAIKARAKGEVVVRASEAATEKAFAFSDFSGVKAEYYANRDLSGTPKATLDVAAPNLTNLPAGIGPNDYSVRWTGKFNAAQAGAYLLTTKSDDGVRLWVDDKPIIEEWHDRGADTDVRSIRLTAGSHTFRLEYYQRRGLAALQFGLLSLDEVVRSNTPENLGKDDTVIACVGFNSQMEGEGFDRPFALPMEQQLMLDAITSRTRNVVIVVNSGAGVDLSPWANKVRGIVQAWYPGQNGNTALAEILYGDTNPSGKLPTSFPLHLEGTYYADAYPAKDHRMPYSEGLLMGYRGLDRADIRPLFPFGFGLSYTKFKFSDLQANPAEVKVTVENTGSRAGAEVVQVYLGRDKTPADRPLRELKSFARVTLAPGEKKTVSLPLDPSWLSIWDPATKSWRRDLGKVRVWVGSSSRDLPLNGEFETF
ncbi:glycoside hydrolase family 3 C-terminal domain-containing protein [soil metagenome]